MPLKTQQHASARKAAFECRLDALGVLMSLAVQETEKAINLEMALAKASTDSSLSSMLGAKDPHAYFSLEAALKLLPSHGHVMADVSRRRRV